MVEKLLKICSWIWCYIWCQFLDGYFMKTVSSLKFFTKPKAEVLFSPEIIPKKNGTSVLVILSFFSKKNRIGVSFISKIQKIWSMGGYYQNQRIAQHSSILIRKRCTVLQKHSQDLLTYFCFSTWCLLTTRQYSFAKDVLQRHSHDLFTYTCFFTWCLLTVCILNSGFCFSNFVRLNFFCLQWTYM